MPDRDGKQRARKDSSRAAQVGRARLLIKAHLGWLGGYPGERANGGIAWRGALVDHIDRATLAASTRALNKLHRDHAAVLPLIVGDVAAWDASIAIALDTLKAAIHDGAALPGMLA